jgi:hypothetical protein
MVSLIIKILGGHLLVKRLIPLILLILPFLFVALQPVRAQDAQNFDSVIVELWPEYDRPSTLVIYTATLSPSVSLPADLTFQIPKAAGEPHAVAVGPSQASIADVVYETQITGEWIGVSFIATTPVIRLEYYDPRLDKDGAQRTFEYEWPGDLAVASLVLNVQHPIGASNLQVSPTAGQVLQNEDGFTYNVIDLGALGIGESFKLNVQYSKESDSLSAEGLEIEPSALISPGSGFQTSLIQWIPWLLGGLGLLLIVGGGFWYWRTGREMAPIRLRRRRNASQMGPEGDQLDLVVYCHQCGKRAESGDRFCRACGTRLRTE